MATREVMASETLLRAILAISLIGGSAATGQLLQEAGARCMTCAVAGQQPGFVYMNRRATRRRCLRLRASGEGRAESSVEGSGSSFTTDGEGVVLRPQGLSRLEELPFRSPHVPDTQAAGG
jgi:hypothetical protein